MENLDRENIDEFLEIRQIHQHFPPSKICAIRYNLRQILPYNVCLMVLESIIVSRDATIQNFMSYVMENYVTTCHISRHKL